MIVKILHKLREGQEGERQGLFRQRNYPFTCSMISFFRSFLACKGAPKRAAEIMLVNIIKSDSKKFV